MVSSNAFGLIDVPPLSGPVVDLAGMVDSAATRELTQVLTAEVQRGGPQLAILTVPTLDGEPIEQFSIRVADQWKLGTAKGDNGLLIVVAQQDRRLRIEVGQGLEGNITDIHAHRIIQEVLVPSLKQGDLGSGLVRATQMLFGLARGEDLPAAPARRSITRRKGFFPAYVILFFLFMAIISRFQRRHSHGLGGRRSGNWGTAAALGSILGSGRRGGGGFGGGGGGGGFSGGGSSGSW